MVRTTAVNVRTSLKARTVRNPRCLMNVWPSNWSQNVPRKKELTRMNMMTKTSSINDSSALFLLYLLTNLLSELLYDNSICLVMFYCCSCIIYLSAIIEPLIISVERLSCYLQGRQTVMKTNSENPITIVRTKIFANFENLCFKIFKIFIVLSFLNLMFLNSDCLRLLHYKSVTFKITASFYYHLYPEISNGKEWYMYTYCFTQHVRNNRANNYLCRQNMHLGLKSFEKLNYVGQHKLS